MRKAYQIKIAVKNSKPPAWCRCIIPSGITYSQLSILLTTITGEKEETAFEFDFYHKKVRVFENQRVRSSRSDYYYNLMGAFETFIDDLLDTEEWFSLNLGSGNSYRITVENIQNNFSDVYASVQKYNNQMTAPCSIQSMNEMLKEKYALSYGSSDFRTRKEIQMDIEQGNYGLKGSESAVSKTTHYKKPAENLMQEFADQILKKSLDAQIRIKEKESLKIYLALEPKEELKYYAEELGLRYTSLSKKELAEKIANHILSPSAMKQRLCTLSDEQVAAFEEAIGVGGCYRPREDVLNELNILYELDYIIIYDDDWAVVPDEVIAAYTKINTPEFHNQRKQIVWMQACLEMHAMIYGIAPVKILHKMYRKRPGYKVDREEWLRIFKMIPEAENLCVIQDDKVILKDFLENELYLEIEESQRSKDFYVPNYKEVLDCFKNKYPSAEPVYQQLKQFFIIEMQMEEIDVVNLIQTMWSQLSLGYDFHDVMDTLNDRNIIFPNKESLMKLSEIIQNVNNHTRMLPNRGFMPVELAAQRSYSGPAAIGKMPTIMPMSSTAAEMLGSSQKEIEEMGFSIDLNSNAHEIPVGVMRHGLNGGLETGSRKIYPNDPCPCGSGKKYKKCCGRNRQ